MINEITKNKIILCPICAANRVRQCFVKQGIAVLACEECTVRFWQPKETEAVADIYNENYFVGEETANGYNNYLMLEPGLRKTFRKRLQRIQAMGAPGKKLLEVGCGTGFFLDEARKAGFEVIGVELSGFGAKYAQEKLRLNVKQGKLLEQNFASQSFDVVCMWDVLEHLPDPLADMKEVRRLLKPGGKLLLSTGNAQSAMAKLSGANWHLYTLPEHLFFFTPYSVEALLKKAGFSVIKISHPALHLPISYLAERLRKTLHLPTGFLIRIPWIVPVNLFDVMTVEARANE